MERFGVQKGDSEFAAVGGSVPVVSADRLAALVKGLGEATRNSVEDNGSAIAAVSVKTQRLRVAAEASRIRALPGGGTFTLSVEAQGRALVAHRGGVEEWGVSGAAQLSPGFGDRGWSFALSPR